MKLANMERSEKQEAELAKPMCDEKYPYGLRLHLNKEEMKKLGIKEMPKVGDEFKITAVAKVCDISEHESEHGGHRSMGLQITDMGMGKGEKTDAEVMYED